MAENPKRLTTEEIWASALAVIGGLAVLIPLIVSSLSGQSDKGDQNELPPLVVGEERPREVDLPVPETSDELREELLAARAKIDLLGGRLDGVRAESESNLRSAERAWKQLKAAGEFEEEVVERE